VGFLASPGSKTPEPIAMKIGVLNYVGDPTLTSKYGSGHAMRGRLGTCVKYHCLWQATGRQCRPIFTIYTSNVFAQASAFWGSQWWIL